MAQGNPSIVNIFMSECSSLFKLHMIENRFRLEREIFRGRQSVRQLVGAGRQEDMDLPAPDRDPSHPALEAGLGAPTSSETSPIVSRGGTLPPETQDHLAIESDAERGYTAGSQRFFRQSPRRQTGSKGERALDLSGSEDDHHEETGRDPLSSPVLRRRWASDLLGDQQSRDIKRNRVSTRAASRRTAPRRAQTEAPDSPTFLTRFRTASIPDFSGQWSSLSPGSASRPSTTEESTHTGDRWRDNEGWSSSDDDDADVSLEDPLSDRSPRQHSTRREHDPPEQDK